MKNFYFLLSFLALIAFSCSKESLPENGFSPDSSGRMTLKAANGAVINLSPSADGDDTDEMLNAFEDAKAAGPGSAVQLAAGEYHIGFVLVKDFIGSFTGAGIGKTIIIPLPDLPWEDMYDQNLAWILIKFLRGDVRISDMSFLNLEGEPCPGEDLFGFIGIHDYAVNELPDLPAGHKITAVVDHVEFVSNPGPAGWSPYAVQGALGCGVDFYWDYNLPYSDVDITITNCRMSEMHLAFTNLSMEKGRTVFKNNGPVSTLQGLLLYDNIGGRTQITGNEFFTPEGGNIITIVDALFGVNEFKLSDGCQYEISGNIFHAKDAWGAVTIADDRKATGIIDNKNPVLVQIKSNLFDLQGSTVTGIWNWITDDAVIMNNKFIGQTYLGIYVDPRATNSLMLGNNFSGLVCNKTSDLEWLGIPYDYTGYNILLLGNKNTVIGGGNNRSTVLNLGENNVITGAEFNNIVEKPVGGTITDNYRIWKETLVNMRKR